MERIVARRGQDVSCQYICEEHAGHGTSNEHDEYNVMDTGANAGGYGDKAENGAGCVVRIGAPVELARQCEYAPSSIVLAFYEDFTENPTIRVGVSSFARYVYHFCFGSRLDASLGTEDDGVRADGILGPMLPATRWK